MPAQAPSNEPERIRALKRNHPYFTVQDLALLTGYSGGTIRAALGEEPQMITDRMPVYAMKEVAD